MKYSPAQVQTVLGELRRLQARGKVSVQGSRTFILCPFHADRNPSAIVTTDPHSKFFGHFHCFGCEASGDWNKLANKMNEGSENVRTLDEDDAGYSYVAKRESKTFKDRVKTRRLKSSKGITEVMESLSLIRPKRVREDWRGISTEFLNKIGALRVFDEKLGEYALYLPVTVNGEEVGGIRALIGNVDRKGLAKYKNAPGAWSKTKALYPFDHVSEMMDSFEEEYGFRGVVLVEGGRDALTLCQNGIPTLGILGTTSWTEQKRDLLLDLDPDFVLVCMDGDAPGRKAENKIYEDLSDWIPCTRMNLSRFNRIYGFDVDPGGAPDEVVEKILKTLVKRKDKK